MMSFEHLRTPLEAERAALERAEANLEARETLRAAAKRRGMSMANLLGETQFVPRAVAERWSNDAFNKGHDEGE
jgi:hypothetical protein